MVEITREELENFKIIKAEFDSISKEVEELQMVTDTVRGSSSEHPWTAHTMKIEGIDEKSYNRLRKRMEQKRDELQGKLWEMEVFLDEVEDDKMRTILRLKFRNGLTDREIGELVGYSRSRVNELISNFFRK